MSEVIFILFFIFAGYSLTASGILPYSISPFFCLSALSVFATVNPSAGLFTALFLSGLFHDSIMALSPGVTPLFILLIYPILRILYTNFNLPKRIFLALSALSATFLYAIFLFLLPGRFPYTYVDTALKIIFTPMWAVLMGMVTDKIRIDREKHQRL